MYVFACNVSFCLYLDHPVILVLPTTVVGVEMDRPLSQGLVIEEMVKQADHSICTFACHHSLINKVVHLYVLL